MENLTFFVLKNFSVKNTSVKNVVPNFCIIQSVYRRHPMKNGVNAQGFVYKVNDTSCPVQIRDYPKLDPPIKRWPDAIGFGFGKCGTGALAFLDCHPKIVFRTQEPHFFNDDRTKRFLSSPGQDHTPEMLEKYLIPKASKSEFLIEKTPMYAQTKHSIQNVRQRLVLINKTIPNVKIFMFLCDPVKRLYSHLNHCIREGYQG